MASVSASVRASRNDSSCDTLAGRPKFRFVVLSFPESRWEDHMRARLAGVVALLAFGPLSPPASSRRRKSRPSSSTARRSRPRPRPRQVQDDLHDRRQGDARTAGQAGVKGEGTWKLSKEGFCTSWKGSAAELLHAGEHREEQMVRGEGRLHRGDLEQVARSACPGAAQHGTNARRSRPDAIISVSRQVPDRRLSPDSGFPGSHA